MMEHREQIVTLWFSMWLEGKDLGIRDIFDASCVYVESWGPQYVGVDKIELWFREWNTRGHVTHWEIRQFFHKGDQTVVEWCFRNEMDHGERECFEGMSLIRWTAEDKIKFLQEFGCNLNRYDPYAQGDLPRFREEAHPWF